jgi:hypothetical protein
MDAKTLEHKLQLSGYKHPESVNDDRGSKYKTFSDSDINRKAKNIDDFKGTISGRNYTLNKNVEALDICPKCNSPVIRTCNCAYSDKHCKYGHIWYVERNGDIKFGNPH